MSDSDSTVPQPLCCFFPGCGASMISGATLYRVNALGSVPAVWTCGKHRANTDAPRDPALDELVSILEEKKR